MADYPGTIAPVGHSEPVPRRIRAVLDGEVIVDTVRALYVWEWPPYPQYYLPLADFRPGVAVDELRADVHEGPPDTARLRWDAVDAWYEEDEQVFVHPRSPYARADAIRSTRSVRIELEGVLLAQTAAPVAVFETGLPPRWYIDRTAVDFGHLVPSETVSECPYKGRTSAWWSIRAGDEIHDDLAWSYDFPTREMLAITGLVAFFDERVDVILDGELQERPKTPFFD